MLLLFNSILHFLVDAVCVSVLFSSAAEGTALQTAVILYNCLAFSTQCVVGLFLDRCKNLFAYWGLSVVLVLLGALLPLPLIGKVIFVGIGNSMFHVAAGTMTLRGSRKTAGPLGIFVAPGAIGVTFGTLFPGGIVWLCVALCLCAAAVLFFCREAMTYQKPNEESSALPVLPVVLLTTAVAVRAIGGAAVSFSWKTGIGGAILMTAAVFAGKALGGLFCDRFKPERMALLSIPLAAVCIAFFSGNAVLSLVGQFLLNLSMPVTLWLLYLAMPDAPAFAFGLAASALWPGTIAGMLFQLTGPALWICVIVSFLFGLFAILLSVKLLHLKEREIEK